MGARKACEIDEGGAADVVGYRLEGELKGVAEKTGTLLAGCMRLQYSLAAFRKRT